MVVLVLIPEQNFTVNLCIICYFSVSTIKPELL